MQLHPHAERAGFRAAAPQNTSLNMVLSRWGNDTAAKVSRVQRAKESTGRCHGAQPNNGSRGLVRRCHRTVQIFEKKRKKPPKSSHWCASTPDNQHRHKSEPTPPKMGSLLVKRTNHATLHSPPRRLLTLRYFHNSIYHHQLTICVGLRSWQGWVLKGRDACWDCGLLREGHSGRRCPAGRASGGCSMVNRPFMVAPQSLLSRDNLSSPARRDEEGGGAPGRALFFFGGGGGREPPTSEGGANESKQSSARIQSRRPTATCRKPTIHGLLDHLEKKIHYKYI